MIGVPLLLIILFSFTRRTAVEPALVQFDLSNDDDELIPVFPITVTLEDGTELVKENLEDFEALIESCFD